MASDIISELLASSNPKREWNINRFLSFIAKNPITGCWHFTGPESDDRYGSYCGTPAHRFSYTYFTGEIPLGLEIDHKCRQPRCVNPHHLEAVTPEENKRRNYPYRRVKCTDDGRTVINVKAVRISSWGNAKKSAQRTGENVGFWISRACEFEANSTEIIMAKQGNPDEEKTIINVKGVSATSWERARISANRNGETMGSWLSRACDQLTNIESGQRIFEPAKTVSLPDNRIRPAIDLNHIATILSAMRAADVPVQKRVGREINTMVYAMLREGRGLPLDHAPLIAGKEISLSGKAISQEKDSRDAETIEAASGQESEG